MGDLRAELRSVLRALKINPDSPTLKGDLKKAWLKWHPDKNPPKEDENKSRLLQAHYTQICSNIGLIQEKRRTSTPPPPPPTATSQRQQPPPAAPTTAGNNLFSRFGKVWAEKQKATFKTFFQGATPFKATTPSSSTASKAKVTTDHKRPATTRKSSTSSGQFQCKYCTGSTRRCEMHCVCAKCKSAGCPRQTRVRLSIRRATDDTRLRGQPYGPFYEIEGDVQSNPTLKLLRLEKFASIMAKWQDYVFVEELLPLKGDERQSDWPRETAFTVDDNKKVTRHGDT